ncbi:MAG TPA: hypothetical protein VK459_06650 [Polyangiaceae bacterium]|jgi:hypothetical protein|nr:hypothetical protein [Polyangiaceae bacterium]
MVSNDGTTKSRREGTVMRELFRSPHMWLRHDKRHDIVIVTRFPLHFDSVVELNDTFSKMELAVQGVVKQRSVLFIDSREAPLRNDPVFEAAFEANRRRFIRGFRKVSALVKTAVGKLQIQRHSKIDGIPIGVFTDPGEALAYLELPPWIEIN